MKISNLSSLPAIMQGRELARLLHSYPSTITRAYQTGALRGSKIGRRTVLFAKADVLDWLGFEVLTKPAPAAPAPQQIEEIVAKTPAARR
jgi:hypothetical protein